jgi:hypothetical protein
MNKAFPLALLFALVVNTSINGQEKRIFTFNKQIIEYYMFSNMTPSFTKFPNHKAKFIIIDTDSDLYEYSKSNRIENVKEARKDRTLYYYFKLPKLKDEKEYLEFFKKFTEENYRKDFFDRNTASLKFGNEKLLFNCESLDYLNTFLSILIVVESSELLECGKAFIISSDREQTNLKTSIKYESINIMESEQKREDFEMLDQLKNWNKTFFITIYLGQNFIDSSYKTDFDEETLVDISDTNSIWQFNIGYMFSNKFGGLLDFGFMSAKEQYINFSTLSGTGSGFGVFKLGLGVRYVPFIKKNWSIYSDLKGGTLNVKAAGGTGGIGGFNATERDEASNYLGVSIGAIHRLGKVVFLKSNLEYTSSNFENNIGSISGFTGYTINLGIGFSF